MKDLKTYLDEQSCNIYFYRVNTVEPLLRGHPDEKPAPLERPLDYVNLNINVLISTPDKRPPLLKGHFPDAKGVASQEGFHCITYADGFRDSLSPFDFHLVMFKSFYQKYWNKMINIDSKYCVLFFPISLKIKSAFHDCQIH